MRAVTIGVVSGIGGVMVALLVWHLWADHLMLHQMVAVMSKQLQQYPLK